MTKGVPSVGEIVRMRGFGATSPTFLPATQHVARFPVFIAVLVLFFLIFAAMTYASVTDPDLGWAWSVGAGTATVLIGWFIVTPFRLGVALDRGRVGMRHPFRPGTVWVDLDQVDLAFPGIHIGFNLGGARRGGRRYDRPAGHSISLNLWSRSHGFAGFVRWGARFRLIPRQRRFVDDAEARLGRLRGFRIDQPWYEARALAAILIHLRCQLPPHQARQLDDIEEYGRLLRRWAAICYEEGGKHRRDWRRDPRTLDPSDLRYGPGFTSKPDDADPVGLADLPTPWWRRARVRAAGRRKGPFG